MNIWLPYLETGSGTDVYTRTLADALKACGHNAVHAPFSRRWQYFPWPLRFSSAPAGTEVILANTWNGFAFRREGCKLVVVEHHCVLTPAYSPYRNTFQALFHEWLVRGFEKASLKAADAIVAVSTYTARSLRSALGGPWPEIIFNGIDTDFFCPHAPSDPATQGDRDGGLRPFGLLFVGNLSRRKGADLLPDIMAKLGPGFELRYTLGMRGGDPFSRLPGMTPLGRLSRTELRNAYRQADALLFPTRFEGFGYAAAEAMACGTPVIASACSSLPELVEDRVTGKLCPVDDTDAFVAAIRALAADRDELHAMGERARSAAVDKFALDRWAKEYLAVFTAASEAAKRFPTRETT
ncbi:MAG: glycosyltransferase family 4 protein [Rhodospirillales bacterium]|nr:glycosyltransferase family 4 protein [Rhodospirillales bacterium]MDH3968870.1 glycosyltransferase family 4 protein [Rhodospirillales bacterium]